MHTDHLEHWNALAVQKEDDDNDDSTGYSIFNGHHMLGSPCKLAAIRDIETVRTPKDHAFTSFHRKFTKFLNDSLGGYGYRLESWITIPSDFRVMPYSFLSMKSCWLCLKPSGTRVQICKDKLRVHHGLATVYRPSVMQPAVPWVWMIWLCSHTADSFWDCICPPHLRVRLRCPGVASFDFALVQPLSARTGLTRRMDRDFRLHRVKAVPRASSVFIPISSIIRGAVLVPDTTRTDEYFMFEHVDSDMFLQMNQDIDINAVGA